MKTVLFIFVGIVVFGLCAYGLQIGLKNLMSVPQIFVAADGIVYDSEGAPDLMHSEILGILNTDGAWVCASKWSDFLKKRSEVAYVASDWTPPLASK